ncbi:MAG: thymidine kinase [Acidobacteria bacterium]|nr:thymidine kinase [Acidobacteriota bacterium]
MAKLYFRYGTVGSAKTLNLLAVAHNYRQQGKTVMLIKPKLDIRFGEGMIRSRAGLEKEADLLIEPHSVLDMEQLGTCDCVLVDEVQFLSESVVSQLRRLTRAQNVPVICYGLRTDFRTQLFEGSRRLLEVADSIEEIKTVCHYCNKKAIFNLKLCAGAPTLAGPSVDLGAEEKYLPCCHGCYCEKLNLRDVAEAKSQPTT